MQTTNTVTTKGFLKEERIKMGKDNRSEGAKRNEEPRDMKAETEVQLRLHSEFEAHLGCKRPPRRNEEH